MKEAVMYGGGNIGRGFIGALMSGAGYEVTFIDVAEPVVKELQEKRCYPLRFVSNEGHEDLLVRNVTAVNGNDTEAASDVIARCALMATAVGARILKFIVPNIVAGLRKRWAAGGAPLNIIICENLNDANKVVERMIKEQLSPAEQERFDAEVGLVEASIGRMVPVQTDEMKDGEPLRVCVEKYGFLPVDKAAFKGTVPEIPGMVPFEPFDFFVKRKLFIHNMGHATTAYLGGLKGVEYIFEAIDDPEIRVIAQNAMLESALALSRRYQVDLSAIQLHITDLLGRFTNAALKDTCARVGGDPARKLSPADRLIGSATLALEEGITPAYIAVGAAAGVKRFLEEAQRPQTVEEAGKVLAEVSALAPEAPLARLILAYYAMIAEGCSLKDLRRKADAYKAASLKDII
jgi:mannitol-1-phosphate 5-dehydrogenase